MKINKIQLLYLRNDGHFQFHRDFGAVMEKFDPAALKVKPQYDEWAARFEREDEALKKITKSALTKQINDADKARDNTYSGMVEIADAYLKHYDPVVAEAARRLKILFDTYGNIAKKPLKEQTSAAYNILQELQGKYAADCAAVNIGAWANRLAVENNTFNQLMADRFSETAARSDIVLKEARRAVDESFKAICDIINVYVLLEGAAAYEEFVKTLNAVIAKYAVRTRHRHAANGAEDAGPEEGAEAGAATEAGGGGAAP